MDLTIQTISEETEHQVILGGEIDAYTCPKVKERLLSLLEAGATRLTVDLKAVEYMDSTGIGMFVALMKACKRSGCSFFVENLSERVERLFRITGFYDLIAIRKGEEA
ncbi:anti-sigma B factor antagonist [Brevibacillus panacihumi W25]|uniref:Anti-sigma factor antagonist n=1 Tax=Brevibacillus panacihumi W25 TaxID=1408254 RepID=V6M758_9BACL|nr:anti-sigma factor antagonist [Brevibacillus panacihumi]EST54389.1 anti-sigma B factor antagonist [Brevibacillus panacihumi W25]